MRVRGRGIPHLRGGRGDLLARLVVWVPQRVPQGERKLLEELRRSEAFKPPQPGRSAFERVRDAFAG